MNENTEHELQALLIEAARLLGCSVDELEWWSWPQVFGSTSGPRGGIGGQAMTAFQVFGFSDGGNAVKYCGGVWRKWDRIVEGRW